MNNLNQVLESALELPYEQQEILIKILQNRHYENRRAEIAEDAQKTLADFRAGNYKPQSYLNHKQESLYLLSVPGMRESIRFGLTTPIEECDRELEW